MSYKLDPLEHKMIELIISKINCYYDVIMELYLEEHQPIMRKLNIRYFLSVLVARMMKQLIPDPLEKNCLDMLYRINFITALEEHALDILKSMDAESHNHSVAEKQKED